METFGSLTKKEEESLYNELEANKFDKINLNVILPKEATNYGQLQEFTIEYNVDVKNTKRQINLKIIKKFYTKI